MILFHNILALGLTVLILYVCFTQTTFGGGRND